MPSTLHECAPLRARITAAQCALNQETAPVGSPCRRCAGLGTFPPASAPTTLSGATPVQQNNPPSSAQEFADGLGVAIHDVYTTVKRVRQGMVPARGKALRVAEGMRALGIGPEYFDRRKRPRPVSPIPSPAPVAARDGHLPDTPSMPAEGATVDATPERSAIDLRHFSFEAIMAEIIRRMPGATVTVALR